MTMCESLDDLVDLLIEKSHPSKSPENDKTKKNLSIYFGKIKREVVTEMLENYSKENMTSIILTKN